MADRVVTRFAPSPTGRLHLGHAYAAVFAHDWARAHGGRFLLRIEDIDGPRCRPEFESAIFDDLVWLGLSWDGAVLRQSDRLVDYREALNDLAERGLIYRCFRTRKDLVAESMAAPHWDRSGPPPPFRGAPLSPNEEAARLADGDAFAWRLSLEAAQAALGAAWDDLEFLEIGEGRAQDEHTVMAEPARLGDEIVGRKDIGVSYHLACVLDDAAQGVTHVPRGEDLFEATHLHALLQRLLDVPTPIYAHHRLVTDLAGKRLAKRDSARELAALRAEGVDGADLVDALRNRDLDRFGAQLST